MSRSGIVSRQVLSPGQVLSPKTAMSLFILGNAFIVNIFVGFTIYESLFLYYNEALEYIRAPGSGGYAAPDFTGRGIYTWEDIRYGIHVY